MRGNQSVFKGDLAGWMKRCRQRGGRHEGDRDDRRGEKVIEGG